MYIDGLQGERKYTTEEYILKRKSDLLDFGISQIQIDSLKWCYVETKAQADQLFRSAIDRYL